MSKTLAQTRDRLLRGVKPNPKKDRPFRRVRPKRKLPRMSGQSRNARHDKLGNDRIQKAP